MELKVSELQIGYDKVLCTVDDLLFQPGKVYVLLGNNGLGKTTFFKTLAGLVPSLSGEVSLNDRKVIAGKAIAFVGTARPAIDYLTVRDYLSFGFASALDVKCQELLKEFQLLELIDKNVEELSDGQFRKLAVVRQLLKRPKVILLDEPSAFLDGENKRFLVKLFKSLKMSSIVILSTHDLHFAASCADQYLELKDKRISFVEKEN